MLDLVFIALFQAVVGAPEAPPEQAAAAATTQETEAERVAREAEEAAQEERRCRQRDLTGSRLQRVITCRNGNGHQSEDARTVMEQLQRPPGTTSN